MGGAFGRWLVVWCFSCGFLYLLSFVILSTRKYKKVTPPVVSSISPQYTLHVYNLQVLTTDPLSFHSEIIAVSSSLRVCLFNFTIPVINSFRQLKI